MKARIELRDSETNEVLEVLGTVVYQNERKAIRDANEWNKEKIENYAARFWPVEIVLVGIWG
jgi:hypothetical protein